MALDKTLFKEVGGPGNEITGGQVYSQHSTSDTLDTMMASGYLDGLNGTLNSDDIIILSGSDGCQMCQILNTLGVITVAKLASGAGAAEAQTGSGAASLLTEITNVTSDGANTTTLANGLFVGHTKTITLVGEGTDTDVEPATTVGAWTGILLANIGDTCRLQWNGTGWIILGVGAGTAVLPVIS